MTATTPKMQALQSREIAEKRKAADEALEDLRAALDKPLSDREWLLRIAAEVEQDPRRWTQRALFRNALGVKPDNPSEAASWCALGFICRAELADENFRDDGIRFALKAADGSESILATNDGLRNAAQFVHWFRRAAELCT